MYSKLWSKKGASRTRCSNLGVVADLTRQSQQKLDSSASSKKIPLMESEAAREFLNRYVFSKGSVDERFRDK